MFNVRLAGGHLYGKQLFTWLSLVVSLMASFVLSFFPLDVLDEIWDLIESVSEGFLTYSYFLYNIFRERGGGVYKSVDRFKFCCNSSRKLHEILCGCSNLITYRINTILLQGDTSYRK